MYKTEVQGSAYDECKKLASRILDTWYSKWNAIDTNYSRALKEERIDTNQKKFEALIKNERKRYREENPIDDEDSDEPKTKKKQKIMGNESRKYSQRKCL